MKLQDWLKSYITRAFSGVAFEDGVDIHTAMCLDSYGFDQEKRRLGNLLLSRSNCLSGDGIRLCSHLLTLL